MINVPIRTMHNPLDAKEVDREIKEVKSILQKLPIYTGKGSPEGKTNGEPGSLYINLLGGTGETLFVKETGSGSTGWVAK